MHDDEYMLHDIVDRVIANAQTTRASENEIDMLFVDLIETRIFQSRFGARLTRRSRLGSRREGHGGCGDHGVGGRDVNLVLLPISGRCSLKFASKMNLGAESRAQRQCRDILHFSSVVDDEAGVRERNCRFGGEPQSEA